MTDDPTTTETTNDALPRVDGPRSLGGPDLPRPAPVSAELLLMAIIVAWDKSDYQAFINAMTLGRRALALREDESAPCS